MINKKTQIYLAFGFGVVFLLLILLLAIVIDDPTATQFWIFRVVGSLAAAGIGAIIPGFIIVRVSSWIRAGGALALFVVCYTVNPPELINDQAKLSGLLREATIALSTKNYDIAADKYTEVLEKKPDNSEALYGLGFAQFQKGQFHNASKNFLSAWNYGQKLEAIYQTALSEEALKNFSSAQKFYVELITKSSSAKLLHANALFSVGQLQIIEFFDNKIPSTLAKSMNNFETYNELSSSSKHWLYYHKACIFSLKYQIENKESYKVKTLELLSRFQVTLKEYESKKAPVQREMAKLLLDKDQIGNYTRGPGYPVPCKPMLELIG